MRRVFVSAMPRAWASALRAWFIDASIAPVLSRPSAKIKSEAMQALAGAGVVTGSAIDLLEIVERARGVVDARLCLGRRRASPQAIDCGAHRLQRRRRFQDPEFIALSGRHVRLLRGAQIEHVVLDSKCAVFELTGGVWLAPRSGLTGPHNVRRGGACSDEQTQERQRAPPRFSSNLRNGDDGRYYSKVRYGSTDAK